MVTRPRSARPQDDIKTVDVALDLDASHNSPSSLNPSVWNSIYQILSEKLKTSDSILYCGYSCLEEFLARFPESPSVRIHFDTGLPTSPPEGLKTRTLKLFKSHLQQRDEVDVRIKTAWIKTRIVDNTEQAVHLRILTEHPNTLITPLMNVDSTNSLGSSQHGPQIRAKDVDPDLFQMHHSMIQSVSPDMPIDMQDRAHRLTLAAFLLNDTGSQLAPLSFVSVATDGVRKFESLPLGTSAGTVKYDPSYCNLSTTAILGRSQFEQIKRSAFKEIPAAAIRHVFVAFGSNVGDRIAMIESACKAMELRDLKITRTSSLYETAPMYVEDQPPFVNGVCQVRLPMCVCMSTYSVLTPAD